MKTTAQECAAVWQQMKSHVESALDGVDAEDRDVILLRFFRHLTHAEIGQRLAISEEAAIERANRALETLCKVLAKRGVRADVTAIGEALLSYAAPPMPAAVAEKLARVTDIVREAGVAPNVARMSEAAGGM